MDPADETRGTFRGISIPRRGKLSFACYDHRPNKVIIAYIYVSWKIFQSGYHPTVSCWKLFLTTGRVQRKIASKSGAFTHQKRTTNRFWDNLFKDSGSGRGVRTASHLFRKMAMSNDIYLRWPLKTVPLRNRQNQYNVERRQLSWDGNSSAKIKSCVSWRSSNRVRVWKKLVRFIFDS